MDTCMGDYFYNKILVLQKDLCCASQYAHFL